MVIKMVEFVYIFYDMLERNIRGIFTEIPEVIKFYLENKSDNMICGQLNIYYNNSNSLFASYHEARRDLDIYMSELIEKENKNHG